MYYFGLYHWRSRLRKIALGFVAFLGVGVVRWKTSSRWVRALAVALALPALISSGRAGTKLLRPPPWALERYKYDALASELPLGGASAVLDVGCGTGRSLVGLAPSLSEEASVLGLDVFDSRVILGNAPLLARRNASEAGIDVTPLRGDAARLPLATGSQDVVTACRVLHDLPAEDHGRALREFRRVCAPDGTLGVLELPITPDGVEDDPETYWRDQVTEAGFSVETVKRVERKRGGEPYIVLVVTPSAR
ncbi:class I SAM-dependent methyltransferase [Halalkalicoccus jeotgali]|uniref:Methyltransferase type 11 n=1 Tax=Halalkalicoccus jeotgali (strain DSM 18796 / CECT 7217 / JCM 14584 / KCTC 4019 / B3) TaxID=795797 RepID=D8J9D0_HALJB|nr:class I SAM-dependent methyltransferase [Halalkalicoccus jeotgali]ADJ14342.1 Methyltransferase type 11 [Halalkalicoccus jeotgali B3]ELY40605.1 type 11 methyltransferase [Halalkalicoccus jeotgali B3]